MFSADAFGLFSILKVLFLFYKLAGLVAAKVINVYGLLLKFVKEVRRLATVLVNH